LRVQTASDATLVVVHLDLELGIADAGANLSLQKTVDDRTPSAGWDVVYAITLTNHGPEYASNVVISDVLPISVTHKADDGAGAYDAGSGAWRVGGVRAGAETTLHITATVDPGVADGTIIVNTAVFSAADQIELDPSGNRAEAALAVAGADLSVRKAVDNVVPREGEDVVYTVTVTNEGNESSVVISDVLPVGLTYVNHDGPGTYGPGTGAWDLGTMGEGVSTTLRITAALDAETRGLQIVNTASVSSTSRVDPYPEDDSATASITAQHPDAVIVALTPGEGGILIYTDAKGLKTTVVVPPHAVSETVTLILSPVPTPTQTGGLSFAGHSFDLTIFQDGAPGPGYTFLTPIHITQEYCDADVVGLLEEQLELHTWNGTAWVNAACGPCDRHPDENWICVPVQHLTRFGLFGRRVPVGGVTRPAPPPHVCLGTFAALAVAALAFVVQKRRER
jgi:uncharacterized repeat protein (TIGR01451 family)